MDLESASSRFETEIPGASVVLFASTVGPLVSTVSDLARWMEAFYGGEVISAELVNEMISGEFHGLGEGISYGLGTMRFELPSGGTYFGHVGRISGYSTVAMYSSESEVSVVLLYSTAFNPIVSMDPFLSGLDDLISGLPL